MVMGLEDLFPGLRGTGYQITSPRDGTYNCIAWAAGDVSAWWWPDPEGDRFWPGGVARVETVTAFEDAFRTLGYEVCDSEDLEEAFEKIALFADQEGAPMHAAKQLPSGRWTSKLGELEDIEHPLPALEGDEYGSVVRLMKRPKPAPPIP